MSNIAKAFEHGKAFIPFITCGYPDLETTEKIVYAMVDAGADLIELGIPFSDPTAEGPVIQEANIDRQGVRSGAQAAPEGHDSDGIYDLRECCILLWFREIYLDL